MKGRNSYTVAVASFYWTIKDKTSGKLKDRQGKNYLTLLLPGQNKEWTPRTKIALHIDRTSEGKSILDRITMHIAQITSRRELPCVNAYWPDIWKKKLPGHNYLAYCPDIWREELPGEYYLTYCQDIWREELPGEYYLAYCPDIWSEELPGECYLTSTYLAYCPDIWREELPGEEKGEGLHSQLDREDETAGRHEAAPPETKPNMFRDEKAKPNMFRAKTKEIRDETK